MKNSTIRNLDRRLEIVRNYQRTAKSMFDIASKDHLSHDWITESIKYLVYEHVNYSRLANADRSEVNGYINCLYDCQWSKVEWVHWYNGVYVGKNVDYSNGFDKDLLESAHCYIGTQDIYTERKFNS